MVLCLSSLQSRLDYMALLMATLHTLTYGWGLGLGLDLEQSHFYLPPTFLLVLVLPLAVLLGRLTLSLPCVALRLSRIRRGWQKSRAIRFTLPEDECKGPSQEDISNV
jgi:metalloreductase STEAP3